ncbi:PepSY domain-containing protein [Oceanicella actignis]|uniref:Peptidase propeptide and YPEB domain-containing protein n=1 Tax=Oceanicella actignis TaxID=1189325 RepID=A0A1M7T8L4_9RHOB|nr:PepSY domain-containing protein [Oceanicella actignis]SET49687.1 Peptidase propeptide and YPEB domain-containing protein [Oceanicella actignis]SHN67043.1 Peptidase propeptide and YPEB domain-containing protein [Oceanicella actignis]
MRKLAIAALAMTLAAPALAEVPSMDTMLGKTEQEVRQTLTSMGFEVRKLEREDGMIEAYFVGQGKMGEVYVNPQTGKPAKLKMK